MTVPPAPIFNVETLVIPAVIPKPVTFNPLVTVPTSNEAREAIPVT